LFDLVFSVTDPATPSGVFVAGQIEYDYAPGFFGGEPSLASTLNFPLWVRSAIRCVGRWCKPHPKSTAGNFGRSITLPAGFPLQVANPGARSQRQEGPSQRENALRSEHDSLSSELAQSQERQEYQTPYFPPHSLQDPSTVLHKALVARFYSPVVFVSGSPDSKTHANEHYLLLVKGRYEEISLGVGRQGAEMP
jgi:hypothetical protein